MARINFNASAMPPSGPVDLPARYSQLSTRQRREAREQYAERQDGACYYCQSPLDGPPRPDIQALPVTWDRFPGGERGFVANPVHLHHCHRSDLTIGAVHAYCNAVLWQYHRE